jgi:dCMP deaminase
MRPTRSQILMETAQVIAKRSTCSRLHVGAVIARDGRILTTGYNGAPAGMPHCDHTCDCLTYEVTSSAGGVVRAIHAATCASVRSCVISVHAEANAVAFAAKYPLSTEGAELFTTHTPCLACAQLLINCGLVRVTYGEPFRDTTGLELLVSAGLEVVDGRCLS